MFVKKVEVKLNKTQQKMFYRDQSNLSCIYNLFLSINEEIYEQYRLGNSDIKYLNFYDFRKYFNNEFLNFNPRFNFLKETNSKSLALIMSNADNSFKRFWKGLSGFPNYKKSSQRWRISIPLVYESAKYKWKKTDRKVKLPSYGWVKVKEKGYILESDHIRSCVLKQEGNKFYCCFLIDSVELENKVVESKLRKVEIKDNSKTIGIDLGIKTYATLSNGTTYNFPKQKLSKVNKKIKKVQRKLNRQFLQNKSNKEWRRKNVEKSNKEWRRKNVEKTKKQLRIIFDKKSKVVAGFIQHIVNDLVKAKHCDNFVVEDLNIKGMVKNRHLSKSIQERNFYLFKQKLINKCNKIGKNLFIANTFYPSSKTCSKCGEVNKDLRLSDRVYSCSCGNNLDRDLNAAINLSYIPMAMSEI